MRLEMCKTMAKALLASSVLVSPPLAHINHVTAITVCGSDALFVLRRLSRRTYTHDDEGVLTGEAENPVDQYEFDYEFADQYRPEKSLRGQGSWRPQSHARDQVVQIQVRVLARIHACMCVCVCMCVCARAFGSLSLSLSFPPSLPSDLSQTCLTAPCIGLLGAAAVKPRRGGQASDAEIQPRRRSRHASARCGSPC